MTDALRTLSSGWFWVPALLGTLLWALVGVVTWRYGLLAGLVAGLAGCGFMALAAGVALVGLFLFDAHEPICAYAGCRRRAPLQLRGAPYARPLCPQHAADRPIPPPRSIETLSVDEFPPMVDASGTTSRPR